MMDDKDEFKRKKKALEAQLLYLEEEGDKSFSSKNDMIASNEVAWELGVFKSNYEADGNISNDILEGLAIRARADALVAKLNTVSILEHMAETEARGLTNIRLIKSFLAIIFCSILYLIYKMTV